MEKPEQPALNKAEVKEELQSQELQKVVDKVIAKIKPYFETCQVVPIAGNKFIVRLITKTHEETSLVMELLDLLSIEGWDEEGKIEIENRFDLEKLLLYRLIDEKQFYREEDEDSAASFNPYSFPLTYGDKSFLARNNSLREKGEPSNEEDREVPLDEGLQKIIDDFNSGNDDSGVGAVWHDISFLKKLSSNYRWNNGKVFDVKNNHTLSAEEIRDVIVHAQQGDKKAMDTALKINIGLVYLVFNRFSKMYPTNNPDEVLQEGLIALSRAIKLNDFNRGASFSTYAVIWIESKMRTAWKKDRLIYLPHNVFENRNNHHQAVRKTNQTASLEERKKELAFELGLGSRSIDSFRESNLIGETYLDIDSGEIGDNTPSQLVDDTSSLENNLHEKNLVDAVNRAIDTLTPREAKIIKLREEYTLDEVGRMFDVTRERIRQIEAKALRKLRHPDRAEALRPFLEQREESYSVFLFGFKFSSTETLLLDMYYTLGYSLKDEPGFKKAAEEFFTEYSIDENYTLYHFLAEEVLKERREKGDFTRLFQEKSDELAKIKFEEILKKFSTTFFHFTDEQIKEELYSRLPKKT